MTAQILDGKALSNTIKSKIKKKIEQRTNTGKPAPGLAVVLVGDDPASEIYVGHKERACKAVGINSTIHRLPESVTEIALVELIKTLNNDDSVHGILVQVPLPKHINVQLIIEAINPLKDVDGFHPYNVGRLAIRNPALRPCTPNGIMQLIQETGIDFHGQNAVIVGASNIVGRPMSLELLIAGATTTVCHRFTPEAKLIEHITHADIVITAVGKPGLVKGDWIKPGAIVIDAGITRVGDGSLLGDVEFDIAKEIAGWITPVPGGVGPMTVACLLENTLIASEL